METNPTLRQIYNNLQDGRIYGYDFTKCKYPFNIHSLIRFCI